MKIQKSKFRTARPIALGKMISLCPSLLRLLKYVKECTRMAEEWRAGEIAATSEAERLEILQALGQLYGATELDLLWDDFERKGVLLNPGLAKLTLAFGVRSRAFMDALSVAPSTRILRTALGLDVYGRPILENDEFGQMMRLTPTFAGLNFRYNLLARKILPGARDVTIVACGDLLEILLMKQNGEVLPENIVACDSSPEVERWRMGHTKLPNIEYRCADLFSVLESISDESQDRVLANGICSYNLEKLPEFLTLACSKLKPGGLFVADLQVAGSHMDFNDKVLGWSVNDFTPSADVAEAIETMELATGGLDFESGFAYIHNMASPFEVMFVFRKSL